MNLSLRRRIHFSWHIAWVSAGIVTGIAVAPVVWQYDPEISWLIIALSLLSVVLVKKYLLLVLVSLVAGVLIGGWRGGAVYSEQLHYRQHQKNFITLSGTVAQDVAYGKQGEQQIHLKNIRINDAVFAGTIWVSANGNSDIRRSDKLLVSGVLSEGFGSFPAVLYKANIQSIERPQPGDLALRFRDWFANSVRNTVSEPEASLGLGFLVGQRNSLPEELEDQLRIAGLTHIIVASGYNLTILVSVTRRLFERASKYLATFSAGLLIVGFLGITGFSPSMSRAGLVSGLSLFAWYYGRILHPLVLLPFAAAITALVNPAFIWGDLGWYLSFAAFTGVILVAPLIHHYFWGDKLKPGILREILVGTFAAQLTTLPIILFTFGKLSLVALPANILVLPFVPVAMLLTFFAGAFSAVMPSVSWLGFPAELTLRYMITVVEKTSQFEFAQTEVQINILMLITSYLVMAVLTLYVWLVTKHKFRSKNSA